jgi:molybdopterin converting factor small subunit
MAVIKYFGQIAEATGCTEEKISLVNSDLKELIQTLNEQYGLERFQKNIAVNQVIVKLEDAYSVQDTDEIVLLPPFSGG